MLQGHEALGEDRKETLMDNNGWDQYKKLIIHELERSNKRLEKIEDRLTQIENKLSTLQVKVYTSAFLISVIITGVVQAFINKA